LTTTASPTPCGKSGSSDKRGGWRQALAQQQKINQ
jgi:hypothetical protein